MKTDAVQSKGITLSAVGGVLIGLLLAAAVIISGFSLILGKQAVAETEAFPTWVDERFANENPYQAVPGTSPPSEDTMIVARAVSPRP